MKDYKEGCICLSGRRARTCGAHDQTEFANLLREQIKMMCFPTMTPLSDQAPAPPSTPPPPMQRPAEQPVYHCHTAWPVLERKGYLFEGCWGAVLAPQEGTKSQVVGYREVRIPLRAQEITLILPVNAANECVCQICKCAPL